MDGHTTGIVKRLFIFGGIMFLLLLTLYFALVGAPAEAVGTSLTLLSLMFISLIVFVWNEMTYHHHIIENGGSEYEITPQVLEELTALDSRPGTKVNIPQVHFLKPKHEEAIL